MFPLPPPVQTALHRLNDAGFSCYLVGGCVRDFLLGRMPTDFDLTTNARPAQMQAVFSAFRCIETGLRHGTLTVMIRDFPLEITTYRVDGAYSDSRHPDAVIFTENLCADLARRDFTVNAIAYHPKTGLVDPFDGRSDLEHRLLRCVGIPAQRFSEDALRILRCIRFSSVLGFGVEAETDDAIRTRKDRLQSVAAERIHAELDKLLLGTDVTRVLLAYPEVLGVAIPELLDSVGFLQHSPYHRYSVWGHTAYAVGAAAEDPVVRLAMLLHDLGKPATFTRDQTGRGHFKGHAAVSAEMTKTILTRLRYPNKTVQGVTELVARHSDKIFNDAQIRRLLAQFGTEWFFRQLEVRRADMRAKEAFCLRELDSIDRMEQAARRILKNGDCLSLHDLLIDGSDLQLLGAKGRCIGRVLDQLLERVLDGSLPNSREPLFYEAERLIALYQETNEA